MFKKKMGILRIEKLKTEAAICAMSAHWRRENPTPNANPKRTKYNRVLMGSLDPYKRFKQEVERRGIKKFRKNGVLALEMLLAFSPEYLRDEKTGKYLPDAKKRLDEWITSIKIWLEENFGDRVLSVHLHCDESNIHAHVCLHVFELKTRKSGKREWGLNARAITGGADKLRDIQDSYAESIKHLGLERGLRGSKAHHTKVSEFYGALNEADDLAEDLNLSPSKRSPRDFKAWQHKLNTIVENLQTQQATEITKLNRMIEELNATNAQLRRQLNTQTSRPQFH
ncbi:hypothetical protein D210916BOD24_32240 [Alteromonas sp. D210916BOD_24]|uniref:MobV family relaxase n=1 Tax=Alteromonas sp. D210916BOD_24 TaxID=3157618 RepID=UPI00399D2475